MIERIGEIVHFNNIDMGHIEEYITEKHFVFLIPRHIKDYHGGYPEGLKRFGKKGLTNGVRVRFQTNDDDYVADSSIEPLLPQPEKKFSELRGFSRFAMNLQTIWYGFKHRHDFKR